MTYLPAVIVWYIYNNENNKLINVPVNKYEINK